MPTSRRHIFLCLALAALLLAWSGPRALAADSTIILKAQGSAPVDLSAPLTFSDAVRLAVSRAEVLRMTQIDMEVSRKNEQDMWYRLFPKLNLIVNYDVPVTRGSDDYDKPKQSLNLSFSTGAYDPIAAYIGHDASRIAVKLAEVLHVAAVQKVLDAVGQSLISLRTLSAAASVRRTHVAALASLAQYVDKRHAAGSVTRLEQKTAQQRLALARLECSQAERQLALERRNLKRLLGIAGEDKAEFNVDAALAQALGPQARPEPLDAEALYRRNVDLRAQALREKLQVYNIRLAQAEHLPKLSLGARTADPISSGNGSNPPYYLNMQVNVPIWAWGETMRGVEKAELNLERLVVAGKVQAAKLQEALEDIRLNVDKTAELVEIAQARTEIQKLELVRREIGYNTNGASFDALAAAREAAILAQLEEIRAQAAWDQARLALRVASGGLISDFIRVDYGELEKD